MKPYFSLVLIILFITTKSYSQLKIIENGNMGVNTDSPKYKLDIKGDSAGYNTRFIGSTDASIMSFLNSEYKKWVTSDNNSFGYHGTEFFATYGNGTEGFRLKNDGSFYIGGVISSLTANYSSVGSTQGTRLLGLDANNNLTTNVTGLAGGLNGNNLTLNYLPKWDGSKLINSLLYENNAIGINSTYLEGKLNINTGVLGTNTLLSLQALDGTYNPRVFLNHVTTPTSQILEFNSTFSSSSGYANYSFSNGSLFVGYLSDPVPGNKLAIKGNGYFEGNLTASTAKFSAVGSTQGTRLLGLDANNNLTTNVSGLGGIGSSTIYANTIQSDETPGSPYNSIVFKSDMWPVGSTAFSFQTYDSSGSQTNYEKFSIGAGESGSITSNLGKDNSNFVLKGSSVQGDNSDHYVGMTFWDGYGGSVTGGNYARILAYSNLYHSWGTVLAFNIRSNSATEIEAMRIGKDGNVSIGTTDTENYKLNVAGNQYIGGNLISNGNGQFTGTITSQGGNSSQWNTAYSWGNHANAGYATHRSEGTQFVDYAWGMYDAYRGGWHASNDLKVAYSANSDALNGYSSDESASGSTIVRRTTNGYIFGTYANLISTYQDVNSSGLTRLVGFLNGDSYTRSFDATSIQKFIGGAQSRFLSNAWHVDDSYGTGRFYFGNATTYFGSPGNWIFQNYSGSNIATLDVNGNLSLNGSLNVSGGNSTQWNAAYNHSQSAHSFLPLTGGTISGNMTVSGGFYGQDINAQATISGSYLNIENSIQTRYGDIHAGGSLSAYTVYYNELVNMSDLNLKTNIADLPYSGDKLLNLRPVKYKYLKSSGTQQNNSALNDNKDHMGFIAQEVQEIFPDLVSQNKDGQLGVNYVELIPILVQKIKNLEERLAKMENIAK